MELCGPECVHTSVSLCVHMHAVFVLDVFEWDCMCAAVCMHTSISLGACPVFMLAVCECAWDGVL